MIQLNLSSTYIHRPIQ